MCITKERCLGAKIRAENSRLIAEGSKYINILTIYANSSACANTDIDLDDIPGVSINSYVELNPIVR